MSESCAKMFAMRCRSSEDQNAESTDSKPKKTQMNGMTDLIVDVPLHVLLALTCLATRLDEEEADLAVKSDWWHCGSMLREPRGVLVTTRATKRWLTKGS